ncbi:thrombospondin type 3 repeat-containing protein, partial [Akkermansiaceae bacterium]|nr:thrombospondin type 3 repeat-containing protein [Akkermansiaceae bacterium]
MRLKFLIMLVLTLPSIAILDDDGDGMSDIWEEKYRASSLLPNADTDGDGQSNLDESRAGTDPYNSNSSTGFVLVLEF